LTLKRDKIIIIWLYQSICILYNPIWRTLTCISDNAC